MSKPPVSYPASCSNLGKDEYYSWIIQNVPNWDNNVDRNTAITNLNNWGMSPNQGMSNDTLNNLIKNCACKSAIEGTALASACACSSAAQSLKALSDNYVDSNLAWQVKDAAYNKYISDLSVYNKVYADKLNTMKNQQSLGLHCINADYGLNDAYCINDNSPGWHQTGWTDNTRGSSGSCGAYKAQVCQRTDTQAVIDATLAVGMTAPNAVNPPGPSPIPPSGSNIMCCVQDFNNITAKDVNFTNIQQNCNQKIGGMIASALTSPNIPNTTPISNTTSSTESEFDSFVSQNSTMLIIGIVIILLLSSSCSGAALIASM